MKKCFAVLAVSIALAAPAWAQEQKATPASTLASSTLKVHVLLSHYQGDKKVSSLPYDLMVLTDERNRNFGRATLRLGTQVPITTMARQSNEASAPLVPTVQYRDVGTNIDCIVTALEDGRFKVDLTIEDSSIDAAPAGASGTTHPSFRSFRASDSMLLRDGQTVQSSNGTDRVNADVWKVDVTLTVVK